MRVKYIYKSEKESLRLSSFPNFHASGSIAGMKKKPMRLATLSNIRYIPT